MIGNKNGLDVEVSVHNNKFGISFEEMMLYVEYKAVVVTVLKRIYETDRYVSS